MAIRRTGMRRIVVDHVEYLWKFARRPSDRDCLGGCAVLVQRPDPRAAGLSILYNHHHPTIAKAVGFPILSVRPSQVPDTNRRAIAAGWQPNEQGGAFGVEGIESATSDDTSPAPPPH